MGDRKKNGSNGAAKAARAKPASLTERGRAVARLLELGTRRGCKPFLRLLLEPSPVQEELIRLLELGAARIPPGLARGNWGLAILFDFEKLGALQTIEKIRSELSRLTLREHLYFTPEAVKALIRDGILPVDLHSVPWHPVNGAVVGHCRECGGSLRVLPGTGSYGGAAHAAGCVLASGLSFVPSVLPGIPVS